MNPKQKAQGAIEYLLIIGAAILVVAIVIIAISGIVGEGTTQANDFNVNDPLHAMLNLSANPIETPHNLFENPSNTQSIKIEGIIFFEQ